MQIELGNYYRAKIKYHRTNDLKPNSLPDNSIILIRADWIAEKGEKFEGEFIFTPAITGLWLPQRDLEILE